MKRDDESKTSPRGGAGRPVEIIVRDGRDGVEKKFLVPREKAKGVMLLLGEFQVDLIAEANRRDNAVTESDVLRELDQKFGRAGAALQGARLRLGLTQIELSEKLRVSQSDLSKMEHGRRSIGKRMARKLAHALKVDYRIFL